jgi:hypothetical protein
MRIDDITESTAAQNFVHSVIAPEFAGSADAVLGALQDGPGGVQPPAVYVNLHKWYQSLPDDGRSQAETLVRYAMRMVLFGFLTVLDGASGREPVEGQYSDYAVMLQVYRTAEDEEVGRPFMSVRANPIFGEEALHDIFADMFDEDLQIEPQ